MVLIEMSPTVPVGWTHVTADEKSLKHSMSLGEYSSQQGVQSSLHANVKRMFGKRQKNWANQNTQAATDRYTFPHFLLYFVFVLGAPFQHFKRRGAISLSSVLRS